MARDNRPRVPKEIREDQAEIERKYRVIGDSWKAKAKKLDQIFNYVAAHKSHFVTLEDQVHTGDFDSELARAAEFPANPKPLRKRYYWANIDLDGYKDGDRGKAEIRTERKTGKGYWEQVVKLGGGGGKKRTIEREEHKRALDGFGVNIDVYTSEVRREARRIIGNGELKPLVMLEGQSKPVLYHPDGRTDVLFEIKFDKGKGFTFDGKETDVIEVEIEVKEAYGVPAGEIEALLDKSGEILFEKFEKDLEPIFEAKPAELFRHLVEWRKRDRRGFAEAFKSLSGAQWETWEP